MNILKNKPFYAVYDNTLSAFVPQQWAMEGVAILLENMVAANLVHRDFEPLFARYGDVVNTRKPGEFQAKRKTEVDDVTVQNATATNIAVPLDQHVHVSFLIRDGEESKSFKSLVDEYLRPAAIAMARMTDQIVLGQVYQFLENQAGTLGGLSNSNGIDFITNTRDVLNKNKAFMDGRSLILAPDTETKMLQNQTFVIAQDVGDGGKTMAEGYLGRKFGFDTYMAQNTSSVSAVNGNKTGAVNNVAGYAIGTTVLAVDLFGASDVLSGQWIGIGGHIYHVIATDNATATQLTLEYGLVAAVIDDAVITVYARDVNVTTRAAGYAKELTYTTTAPAVGQMVTFGTVGTDRYAVVEVDVPTKTFLLDRPLAAQVNNGDAIDFGPAGGDLNLAFHRNCLTLVIRPLNLPRAGTGALAAVQNFGGATMRTTITYDGTKQGHLVTMDFLAGVKILDKNLAAVMLA